MNTNVSLPEWYNCFLKALLYTKLYIQNNLEYEKNVSMSSEKS